jgi:tRNA threonylcarbamoyladenosine biosynthesis protein TsaE
MKLMKLIIKTSDEMQKLGQSISIGCKDEGVIIYLYGNLGSGKTTLVRGFLQGLGYRGYVKSPTFTLIEIYNVNDKTICHFDLYRLSDIQEFDNIGGRDYFTQDNICLVEWPEMLQKILPSADLICNIRCHVL